MKNQPLLFYGPVGGKKGTIVGGGESGNKKTISLLKKLGFSVVIIEKPYPLSYPVIKSILYPLQYFLSYLKFLYRILKNRNVTFHLSGFYNHLIYFEWIFIATCHLLSVRCTYEMRAGGAIEGYRSRTPLYRFFFRMTLKFANHVICQGEEYLPFVKKIAGIKASYYPNYIQSETLLPYSGYSRIKSSVIKLIYFGRVTQSKNLELILEICNLLRPLDFHLEIIGSGKPEYIDSIKKLMILYDLKEKVSICPALKPQELFAKMREKHFFIFPSKEKREGHSNSLTEAMSYGVVPIVSQVGFNATVVKEPDLVIENYNANAYASKIKEIWTNGKWSHYSKHSYKVVEGHFTELAVEKTLITAHK